jgi:hypothetical protein
VCASVENVRRVGAGLVLVLALALELALESGGHALWYMCGGDSDRKPIAPSSSAASRRANASSSSICFRLCADCAMGNGYSDRAALDEGIGIGGGAGIEGTGVFGSERSRGGDRADERDDDG